MSPTRADVVAFEPEIASTTPPFAAISYRNLCFHLGEPGVPNALGRRVLGFANARITYGKGGTGPS